MVIGPLASESAGPARPLLDVGPRPNEGLPKVRDGLGEVRVTPAPVVDGLAVRESESLSDLRGSDELRHIHLSAHSP
jgi:hypothetical protein